MKISDRWDASRTFLLPSLFALLSGPNGIFFHSMYVTFDFERVVSKDFKNLASLVLSKKNNEPLFTIICKFLEQELINIEIYCKFTIVAVKEFSAQFLIIF